MIFAASTHGGRHVPKGRHDDRFTGHSVHYCISFLKEPIWQKHIFNASLFEFFFIIQSGHWEHSQRLLEEMIVDFFYILPRCDFGRILLACSLSRSFQLVCKSFAYQSHWPLRLTLTEYITIRIWCQFKLLIAKFYIWSQNIHFNLFIKKPIIHVCPKIILVSNTRSLVQWAECSPMIRENGVQSRVELYQKTQEMVLDAALLNTQHYTYQW